MHEVEVKAHLRDKEAVLQALAARGCSFSAPMVEKDMLYAQLVETPEAYHQNADFLRIREKGDGTVIFTVKHQNVDHGGRADSMPIEHETTIGSKEEMEAIIRLLGYKEAVYVEKNRQKGKLGKWEICIDDVKDLGSFIEVEEMATAENIESVVAELKTFLASLGVASEDMFADRYDIAVLKKRRGV